MTSESRVQGLRGVIPVSNINAILKRARNVKEAGVWKRERLRMAWFYQGRELFEVKKGVLRMLSLGEIKALKTAIGLP
jgi:hypothetical protein